MITESNSHPTPSEHARALIRGAVDYHVHVAPDFVSRRITDIELAKRCLETGQAGFGLKSHYSSTAERAQVVAAAVPGITVLGTITLNRSVGGLNPLAVEVAARQGARIVWFPTVSAVNEQGEVLKAGVHEKVPVWVAFELSLRESGRACEPVPVVDDRGALLPEADEVLDVIASHGLVLCTGHLGRDEIFRLVEAAAERGIRNIVVTHPEFPSQALSPADQVELAEMGAFMERAFTTPYTGKVAWERVFEATRAVGPEKTVWATDLGQKANPPVEDGLSLMADAFLADGFADEEIRTMAVGNTRRVAGVQPLAETVRERRVVTEPVYDVAHLGRVELLTPELDASVDFFVSVLGMDEAERLGDSVYLRAWGDYERASLQLTSAEHPGVGVSAWRTTSDAALERRVAVIEASGCGEGWSDGVVGHGRTYRFSDPDGHPMSIYYESAYHEPVGDQVPTLKNQPQRMSTRGAAVRRLDHVNVWCRDIDVNSAYMIDTLGFRISERVIGDDGRLVGSWLHVTPKSYDLAYGRVDPAGVGGRLHHVAFAVDAREYVLRAADVFLDAGVTIEAGPAKHAVQQTCFLYALEPGGNRIEVISDGRLLLAPDWRPITWTMEERKRGQAWLTLMPESWFTYATPPVETA